MQSFILHGAPPLGILYNFGLKMGPEKTIWFDAKTGTRNNLLSCMQSAFRRVLISSANFRAL